MNKSIENFYNKENNPEYYKKYDFEHAPRMDFIVEKFYLDQIKNQRVADFGCGAGFFLKRLDDSNEKYGFDGAFVPLSFHLCKFKYFNTDLDISWAQNDGNWYGFNLRRKFDMSFCLETLEHLASPYNALCNMKWMTKENAPIYLSIPDMKMTHNVVYPGLMYPMENFEEFLGQMSLPIEEYAFFNGDWPSHVWKCKNYPWRYKVLKFYKNEEKFRECTPLEATNL